MAQLPTFEACLCLTLPRVVVKAVYAKIPSIPFILHSPLFSKIPLKIFCLPFIFERFYFCVESLIGLELQILVNVKQEWIVVIRVEEASIVIAHDIFLDLENTALDYSGLPLLVNSPVVDLRVDFLGVFWIWRNQKFLFLLWRGQRSQH